MKKLGLGIISLLLISVIYYFTVGSAQVIKEIKVQVDQELTTLQENGFEITQRKIKENQEHFILGFKDPVKITNYLSTQGVQVDQEDILLLKGLKIGVDTKYLNDSYSALSFDIYPVALPKSIIQEIKEDKTAIERINKMLASKTFLLHLDFNKLLSSFKGHIKDINETFEEETKVTVISKGFKFEGDIEEEKVKTVRQRLELFSIAANKELTIKLSNLTSSYSLTGVSPYDSKSHYSIEKIEIKEEKSTSTFITNLNVNAISSVKNNLLKSSIRSKTEKVTLIGTDKTYILNDILFDFNLNNLDIVSFEKLQYINIEDEQAINTLSQKILSKGINMHIPNLSVKKISENGKSMNGFTLSTSLAIDKSFDMNATSQNPLAILDALSSKTNISVSPELFAILVQKPKAMMVLMLMPPIEKEGKKTYEIEFIKGKLTVNGTPMM